MSFFSVSQVQGFPTPPSSPPFLSPCPHCFFFFCIITIFQSFSNSQKSSILLFNCIIALQVYAKIENPAPYCQGICKFPWWSSVFRSRDAQCNISSLLSMLVSIYSPSMRIYTYTCYLYVYCPCGSHEGCLISERSYAIALFGLAYVTQDKDLQLQIVQFQYL